MTGHVVIRADGGPGIGYGHLVRSGALATGLLDRGWTVTYATTTPEAVRDVCPTAVQTSELQRRDDPSEIGGFIDTYAPDVVVADAYPFDTICQRCTQDRVPLVLLQDDNRHAVCADVFINGNLYANSLSYDYICDDPRTCLGPDYVFLRKEITDLTNDEPKQRSHPERALITMGGSDMAELTPRVIRAFNDSSLHVEAIVGPGFTKRQAQKIRSAANATSATVDVVRTPDDLPRRMYRADFAVCTSSTTTYELLALGTPIVCCPVVDNQMPVATALCEHNAATVLDRGASEAAFGRAVAKYISDDGLRRKRSELGRKLVDGRGVHRTVAVMRDATQL